MAPYLVHGSEDKQIEQAGFDIRDVWHDISRWFIDTAHGINDETIMHPYFMAFALIVIWAWPHILALPFWFGKDAYRRIEYQTRNVASHVTGNNQPRRRREAFVARYRSVVNAGYNPPPSNPPLFGGTPLSDGNFAVEEERSLPMTLRVIRWCALAWAAYILGREWYYILSR